MHIPTPQIFLNILCDCLLQNKHDLNLLEVSHRDQLHPPPSPPMRKKTAEKQQCEEKPTPQRRFFPQHSPKPSIHYMSGIASTSLA